MNEEKDKRPLGIVFITLGILLITLFILLPAKKKQNPQILYASVESANVRRIPLAMGKPFDSLREGESVIFYGQMSRVKKHYELRGNDITTNFFKVKLSDGSKGWVFAGALSNIPASMPYAN